jgi:hypothetical protein
VVSVTAPYGRIIDFLGRRSTFLSSSPSVVLMRLSGPRSRPTTFNIYKITQTVHGPSGGTALCGPLKISPYYQGGRMNHTRDLR